MIRYGAQHLITHFFYPVTVLSLWYGILYLIYDYYYSLSRLLLFPYSHFVPSFSGSQKLYHSTTRTRDTCRTLTQIQNTKQRNMAMRLRKREQRREKGREEQKEPRRHMARLRCSVHRSYSLHFIRRLVIGKRRILWFGRFLPSKGYPSVNQATDDA